MKTKPVMFLLTLQLINAAPWALADEQQVVVAIPANGDPLPQSALSNVIWEAGNVIQVCPTPQPCGLPFEKATMPFTGGELLRVEPSIPSAGARASWLAFSESQISLCAMKLDTPDIVCRELAVPNMAGTQITVEPRGPAGHFALRYRYRNKDHFRAMLDTPMLVPMAHAVAQEISAASFALSDILSKQANTTK